jgi:hypothetical protein
MARHFKPLVPSERDVIYGRPQTQYCLNLNYAVGSIYFSFNEGFHFVGSADMTNELHWVQIFAQQYLCNWFG